ncbi:hypothetical protein RIF29_28066 [Crotalaria pallida]|uniref:Germin-like protein n=1 Tax=Crotalaria pallida TaxID=3830 RepID=A0AAN9EQR0_CROPI
MIHVLFSLFATFLLSTTSYVSAIDFCIADLKGAETPTGYPCKPPTKVTVDDFVFSKSTNTTPNNSFKSIISPAFVDQLPALNGLGISIANAELDEGGVVPLHSHADATEVIIVGQGNVIVGFISSTDNKVYVKKLSVGNIMVIPRGLLHFIINDGKGKATGTFVFTSVRPSSQIIDLALFGNNFDSALLQKTTFLDPAEIKRLKGIFKGSG